MFKFLKKIFAKKNILLLSVEDKKILNSKVYFYNQLNDKSKAKFEIEIAFFLQQVPIYFRQIKATRLVELLVASSAIIVTFGHPFRYKKHITSVTIIGGIVSKKINGYTTGEVHYQNSFKTMYLSEQSLIQGFKNNNDKKNVGIHEFVHILDVADGYMDGIPSFFMPYEIIETWKNIAEEEMESIALNKSTIREYGATNIQEFLTVCSEYFFERPKKLERDHPEVYKLLSRTFNFDPIDSYNFKEKANFNKKKKIGRNDPCPCGSGNKYKRCCLK